MATIAEFASVINQSITQSKTWHWRTDNYSEHLALGAYYDEAPELIDGLVESYQGVYDRLDGYATKPLVDWKPLQSTTYFKSLYEYIQSERKTLPQETWVQNQIDELAQLVAETLFQLSLIK